MDTSAAAATGAGTAAWSVQPTPDAAGRTLASVSCATATACTATGTIVRGTGYQPTAEAWNGTSWSIKPTPRIPGAASTFLRGISCPSAASCTAAGYYQTSPGIGAEDLVLAERWNGSAWTAQRVPLPSGAAGGHLFGVSCASAQACTAVGDFISGAHQQRTLAERWTGRAWSVQHSANPPEPEQSVLSGVSCHSAGACTAVGEYVTSAGAERILAERWNGSAWSIQPTPVPPGAHSASLAGVSCPAPAACTAVGTYSPGITSTLTLAEAWNGSMWAVQPTPRPSGTSHSYLRSVSCTSATACTAAGFYLPRGGVEATLAEGWNGSAWSIQPTARPAGAAESFLDSVSCTSAVDCTAVGGYTNGVPTPVALAERHSAG